MNATHTPGPWKFEPVQRNQPNEMGIWLHRIDPLETIFDSTALDAWPPSDANAALIQAAPDLLDEIERTNAIALELVERCARLDRQLIEATNSTCDGEVGEIVRMRQQIDRNRALIARATGQEVQP